MLPSNLSLHKPKSYVLSVYRQQLAVLGLDVPSLKRPKREVLKFEEQCDAPMHACLETNGEHCSISS